MVRDRSRWCPAGSARAVTGAGSCRTAPHRAGGSAGVAHGQHDLARRVVLHQRERLGAGGKRERSGRRPGAPRRGAERDQPRQLIRVPIVEPMTEICRKNSRCRSADGSDRWSHRRDHHPAGSHGAHAVRPRRLADRLEHAVHALGQPGAVLEHRVRAEQQGAVAARPRCARSPTPACPPRGRAGSVRSTPRRVAPWTSIVRAGREAAAGEQHPIRRQVCRAQDRGGRRRRIHRERQHVSRGHRRRAPRTCPGSRSVSSDRRGSVVASAAAGSAITGYSSTGRPSSSTPTPSQPRIIGNFSGEMPTPRRVQQVVPVDRGRGHPHVVQPGGRLRVRAARRPRPRSADRPGAGAAA